MSPEFLRSRGVKLTRLVQRPGEIVITMPLGIHGGVNTAFCVNESVNFVTPRWEPYGKVAQICKCDPIR